MLPCETGFMRLSHRHRLLTRPARTIDLLFRFLQQNNGEFSKRARNQEFFSLTEDEVEAIEGAYRMSFPR